MIGILFLMAFGIYLTVSVLLVIATARWARKNGRGVKRWGFAVAFFMYLLVFWDHIPTLLLYKHYCATKAGFWVYKTPEQWKKENPGVAKTLTWKSSSPEYNAPNITRGYRLNERFAWTIQTVDIPILPVSLDYEYIIDTKNGELMNKRVSVGAGYTGGMKYIRFWTNLEPCIPNIKEFGYYQRTFKRMGRQVK